MKLKLERKYKKATYTIGILYVNGVRFCETCEDQDRGLKQTDSIGTIKSKKVYGETAIPTGTYKILMDVVSPKYSAVAFYQQLCGGKMPRLQNVPGFEGVLIHPGNTAFDSYGCVLVGRNTVKGGLTQSRDTFRALYNKMITAHKAGEEITIEIA